MSANEPLNGTGYLQDSYLTESNYLSVDTSVILSNDEIEQTRLYLESEWTHEEVVFERIDAPDYQRFIPHNLSNLIDSANTLLEAGDLSGIDAEGLIRPRSGDWFFQTQDFITHEGGAFLLRGLHTFPGEEIHLELRTPGDFAINYDLMLVEILPNGTIAPNALEWSDFRTTVNLTTGQAIPETLGFRNTTNQIRHFGALIHSVEGYSTTQPFQLNVGIASSSRTRLFHNPWQAWGLNLGAQGNTNWTHRAGFITRAENHWYRLHVPANRNFDGAYISLDQASINAGHIVEVYGNMGGIFSIAGIDNHVMIFSNHRTYYIRVAANGRVSGQDYTLNVQVLRLGEFPNQPGGGGGQPSAQLPHSAVITRIQGPNVQNNVQLRPGLVPRLRIDGNSFITVEGRAFLANGQPAANQEITATVRNNS